MEGKMPSPERFFRQLQYLAGICCLLHRAQHDVLSYASSNSVVSQHASVDMKF